MKKITIILSLLFPVYLFAQHGHHAPEKVQSSFHRDYPDANDARWTQTNGRWNANFNDHSSSDNGEMMARYDRYGRRVDSHVRYDRNDVPAPVMERILDRYKGSRNHRFTRIEDANGNGFFQVSLNLGGRNRTIYMDEQGHERKYTPRY